MMEQKKKKSIFKRWWFWLIAVIVIIGIAANAGGEDTPKKVADGAVAANNDSGSSPSQSPEPEKTEFQVGESVQLKQNKLTVNKVEKSAGSDFDKPKAGHEFVIVTVTIENSGTENISYNPFDFKMANGDGNITDTGFTTVNTDSMLSAGELAPGGKVSGTLAFEQPKNDPKLQLQYKPSFWSDKLIKVNMQ